MAKKKSIHYVNNREFSEAVVEYCKQVNEAVENDQEIPTVPEYLAVCFMKIAEGLSHKHNFISYTYREEMVMDAVENCLRAIKNYNINAKTRTGKPNAFAYFTQISWYAFLRRIAKENKQRDIKNKFLAQSGIENFVQTDDNNPSQNILGNIKDRISRVKEIDYKVKEFKKTYKDSSD